MTENDSENAKLVEGLRAQDPAAARPLWQRFAPSTFRMLRRTLGPPEPVDDAVQVVLLCVFHRGRRLRPDAYLSELVLKVTARVARAELRRRTVRRLLATRSRAARERAARDSSSSEDGTIARFYRTLDRLSAADRIAFVFHYVESLEVRAVAAAMGGTVAGTRRRLRRALRKVIEGVERDPVPGALRAQP